MQTHFQGTPFHAATSEFVTSCFWYGWGDYVVPDIYTSMRDELVAIRERAALIDMSPIPKTVFKGPDAGVLLDKLITRPVATLNEGRCLYTPWCDDAGLMIGDGLIFRLSADEYIVVGENSQSWFESHRGDLDVAVLEKTDDYGVLSLQGPRSSEILAKAVDGNWTEIGFSELAFHKIAGHDVFIARQGFTGEKGYEIWTSRDGSDVWRAVREAGAEFDILPAGEYAVDIARIEAGLILVSADYTGSGPDQKTANVAVDTTLHITPIEAGLSRLVDFDGDREFIGKSALTKLRDSQHSKRRFAGLQLSAEDTARVCQSTGSQHEALSRVYWGSTGVFLKEEQIGRASSICWSPTVGSAIAFGFLDSNKTKEGDTVQLDLPNIDGRILGRVSATIVETPFIELKRSK
mgnify:CR=1 FL=1|jgi:aminomethyltransferase